MGKIKGAFLEGQGNGVDVVVHWSCFVLNNQCRRRQGKNRNKLIMRNGKNGVCGSVRISESRFFPTQVSL